MVGIIIAVAIAMLIGLYMLGTSGMNKGVFNKGYENVYKTEHLDTPTDYVGSTLYFDADGNVYKLDNIDFFEDNYGTIK